MKASRRIFKHRTGVALPHLTTYELYDFLVTAGFSFQAVAPRTTRKSLAPYTVQQEKVAYYRGQAASLPRLYMLALAMADTHRKPVPPLERETFYMELLDMKKAKRRSLGQAALEWQDNAGTLMAVEDGLAKSDDGYDDDEEDSSSSSSDSSGHDTEDDDAGDGNEGLPVGNESDGDGSDVEADEAIELSEVFSRRVHPDSFMWGAFRFTWRPSSSSTIAGSWQVKCPWHGTSRTACTRTRKAQADTIPMLKAWCLKCACMVTKEEHQGVPDNEYLPDSDAAMVTMLEQLEEDLGREQARKRRRM